MTREVPDRLRDHYLGMSGEEASKQYLYWLLTEIMVETILFIEG